MSEPLIGALAKRAASLYPPLDRFGRGFARGKLKGDPVFEHIVRSGLVPDGARVLDLGCGQGVLGALLVAARETHAGGSWPAGFAPPPRGVSYRGIDLLTKSVKRGQAALPEARIEHADIRTASFGEADVVVILDVLHYIEPAAQEDVLARVREALGGGGTLLLRVADADGSARLRWTLLVDHLATFLRTGRIARMHCRPAAQWRALLESLGFSVEARPMSEGTTFANVLLVARYHRAT